MRRHYLGHDRSPKPEACALGVLELPRYFPRQLLTPDELTLEQDYFRQKMRLHNRMLWGWGTVCGALVCRIETEGGNGELDPWRVMVKPGYLLGPYGDDILIGSEVIVDVRSGGVEGSSCVDVEQSAADPWCSRVSLPRDPGPLFIAVRYRECRSRPVRVQPAGCGCEGEQCEYSRRRDGYEIGILDHCPHDQQGEPPDVEPCNGIPECPPCPDEPWVVLAEVEIDGDGIVGDPDNCSCRRIVVSLARFWCRCEEEEPEPEPEPAPGAITAIALHDPRTGAVIAGDVPRNSAVELTATGSGLATVAKVAVPDGIEVAAMTATADKVAATLKVTGQAPIGPVNLRLLDAADQLVAERADAFRVVGLGQPPAPKPAPAPAPVPGPAPAPAPQDGTPPGGGGSRGAAPRRSSSRRSRRKSDGGNGGGGG